jgi:hypothetical protein
MPSAPIASPPLDDDSLGQLAGLRMEMMFQPTDDSGELMQILATSASEMISSGHFADGHAGPQAGSDADIGYGGFASARSILLRPRGVAAIRATPGDQRLPTSMITTPGHWRKQAPLRRAQRACKVLPALARCAGSHRAGVYRCIFTSPAITPTLGAALRPALSAYLLSQADVHS